jgi:transcriptional regulator with XRE-family HTH domain
MIIFSAQLRAARGFLKISQAELAMATGLSLPTIKGLEAEDEAIEKANLATIRKVKEALEIRGIKFTFSKGGEGDQISEVGVKLPLSLARRTKEEKPE